MIRDLIVSYGGIYAKQAVDNHMKFKNDRGLLRKQTSAIFILNLCN